jgi:hypothetical protein
MVTCLISMSMYIYGEQNRRVWHNENDRMHQMAAVMTTDTVGVFVLTFHCELCSMQYDSNSLLCLGLPSVLAEFAYRLLPPYDLTARRVVEHRPSMHLHLCVVDTIHKFSSFRDSTKISIYCILHLCISYTAVTGSRARVSMRCKPTGRI